MQNRNENVQCHSKIPVTQRRAIAVLENNQATPDASQEPEVQSRPPETVSQYPDEPDPDVRAPQNVFITEGYTPPPRAMSENDEPDPDVQAPQNVFITEGYTPPPRAMSENDDPYPDVQAPQNVFITEGYTPSYRAILEQSEKTRQSRKLDD